MPPPRPNLYEVAQRRLELPDEISPDHRLHILEIRCQMEALLRTLEISDLEQVIDYIFNVPFALGEDPEAGILALCQKRAREMPDQEFDKTEMRQFQPLIQDELALIGEEEDEALRLTLLAQKTRKDFLLLGVLMKRQGLDPVKKITELILWDYHMHKNNPDHDISQEIDCSVEEICLSLESGAAWRLMRNVQWAIDELAEQLEDRALAKITVEVEFEAQYRKIFRKQLGDPYAFFGHHEDPEEVIRSYLASFFDYDTPMSDFPLDVGVATPSPAPAVQK